MPTIPKVHEIVNLLLFVQVGPLVKLTATICYDHPIACSLTSDCVYIHIIPTLVEYYLDQLLKVYLIIVMDLLSVHVSSLFPKLLVIQVWRFSIV